MLCFRVNWLRYNGLSCAVDTYILNGLFYAILFSSEAIKYYLIHLIGFHFMKFDSSVYDLGTISSQVLWKHSPIWHDISYSTAATQELHKSLQWRHNGHGSISNHQPHDCLLNRLFRRRSKKISKLRVTGLCAGNSPGTGEFPAQMARYAENVSIW